jgi:flagellar biogenesis protein FliO
MDIYLTLLKLFAVLIALLFLGYALSALVVAIALGTLETLRQAQDVSLGTKELEEEAQDKKIAH